MDPYDEWRMNGSLSEEDQEAIDNETISDERMGEIRHARMMLRLRNI